jgi:Flp pilus assembly CpaE family ATPase
VGITAGSREVPGRKPVTRDNNNNNNNNNKIIINCVANRRFAEKSQLNEIFVIKSHTLTPNSNMASLTLK